MTDKAATENFEYGVSQDEVTERVRAVTDLIVNVATIKDPALQEAALLLIERVIDSIPTVQKAPVLETFLGKASSVSKVL
jgi:hypothetical protein